MASTSASPSLRPSAVSRSSICERRSSESSAMMSLFCSFGNQNLTACRYRSSSSMTFLLCVFFLFCIFNQISVQNPIQRRVHALPFRHELFQDQLAIVREPVKPLVPLVLLPPLAGEQTLAFEPPQQGIEGAFIDIH